MPFRKQGKITALSHVTYDGSNYVVLEANRERIKLWREVLKLKEWIEIDNLKHVYIEGSSEPTFKTTAHSSIKSIERGLAKRPMSSLFRFVGHVRDDTWSPYGFYILEDDVIVCLAYVKLVSNVPTVKRGDHIYLHEAHRTTIGKNVLLHICCRGHLTNETRHEMLPYPKILQEEQENSLQFCALEHNCNIVWLFSLFNLTRSILKRFSGILSEENIIRRTDSFKGMTALLFDHLSSHFKQDSRSLSKEFLNHEESCVVGMKHGESLNKIDEWRLNSSYIEDKCNQFELWSSSNLKVLNVEERATGKVYYWIHETASVYSVTEPIRLLTGVLTFQNGLWRLKDNSESIPCVLSDRLLHQFKNRCVFATAFHVHRETFFIQGGQEREKCLYLSIDELHAASLPVSEPKVSTQQQTKDIVRFLVLSKSMPLIIYSNESAKLRIFGFFVTATLHGSSHPSHPESPWQPRKKAKVDEESDATLPSNCIFAFSNQHSCTDFSALNEGKVYEICLSKQELLKQRISVPALRDILQSSFRNHVYLVPDHVGVYPVPYNLPKSDLLMHGDVLSVSDCYNLEDAGQTLSLRGWILDRFHNEFMFASERIAERLFETHQGNWFGIPGNKKIVLRLGTRVDSPSHKIDVYLQINEKQLYPFGLFPGTEVVLTWLLLRKTRNTSRIYCSSTALTGFRILQTPMITPERYPGPASNPKPSSTGRQFLCQLERTTSKASCTVVASVEHVTRVSMRVACAGCQSDVNNGACSYVGCHRTELPRTKLDLSSWCTVQDGTGEAALFIAGETCRKWLGLPPSVWRLLEEQILPHDGEYLYVPTRTNRREPSGACKVLTCYIRNSAALRRPVCMIVRKFFGQDTRPSGHPGSSSLKLYCLDIKELDPGACALELATAQH